MNVYKVKMPDADAATGNAILETGINGTRWKGLEVEPIGDGANFEAGNGISYQDKLIPNTTSTVISKIISIEVGDLIEGQDNALQIPLSTFEFSKDANIFGVIPIGVTDSTKLAKCLFTNISTFSGATYNPTEPALSGIRCFIANNALIVHFGQKSIKADFQNKTLNLIIYYN